VNITKRAGEAAHLNIRLAVASVETDIQVSANAASLDADRGANTVTLNSQQIQQPADDPDDFLRQLQMLAAESSGDLSSTRITVDVFKM